MASHLHPCIPQCAIRKPSPVAIYVVTNQHHLGRPFIVARSRRFLPCKAAAEKRNTQEDAQLQVPDVPPAKSAPVQIPTEDPAANTGSDSDAQLSADEIGAQMAQLRAAAKAQSQEKKDGMVEGVLEEVRLIQWPSPQSALLNTLLVIAIVGGTSAVLFGVNTLLTELSRVVYTSSS